MNDSSALTFRLLFIFTNGDTLKKYTKSFQLKLNMSNNIIFIIISILCLKVSISNAEDRRLNSFNCKDQYDAIRCSDTCTIDKDLKMQFKINKSDRTVLRVAFDQGKQYSMKILENCSVFDQQNWDCSESKTVADFFFVDYKEQMINGIYSRWTIKSYYQDGKFKSEGEKYHMCAK